MISIRGSNGSSLDGVVIRAAGLITRRQLLRNAGTFALGTALSLALVGTEMSGTALAVGTCADPCGPSPKCGAANCTGSGLCGTGPPNCQKRSHETSSCGTGNNAWSETYCPNGSCVNHGTWKCSDCCCPNAPHTGGTCTGCSGGTKWACICRIRTCTNCPC